LPRKATEIDWAWFAGVFEGEGTITFAGRKRNQVQLRISMTDEDVVRRCHEIAGGYFRSERHREKRYKPFWRWEIGGAQKVSEVLDRIEPYLGKRRWARAQEAREKIAATRKQGFCKRGHDLSVTRYTAPCGSTECNICRIERQEAKKQAKRKQTV
jgi:hypothetical protein